MLCDRLLLHVAVRWDDCWESHTGLGLPRVWHLAPHEDTWMMPAAATVTIDHPGAPRPKVFKSKTQKGNSNEVLRFQVPLTHEDVATFQNMQGKKVRGPKLAQTPKLVRYRPLQAAQHDTSRVFQHLYMTLGRACKLEWVALRNCPKTVENTHG